MIILGFLIIKIDVFFRELRPNLKRRNINKSKSWPVRRRTKAPRLVLEDSSSEDMEDLLASKENYEHDIERGRNHSQQIRTC